MSAVARRTSVCLTCQARQLRLSRRRLTTALRRASPETSLAVQPEDDGFLLDSPPQSSRTFYSKKTQRQLKHHGEHMPEEALREVELREAALSFEALFREKDARLKTLRSLSNPWPGVVQQGRHRPPCLQRPEDGPISHATFRQNMKLAVGRKTIRPILRAQLLRCEWPRDLFRVVAVAMQDIESAINLMQLSEPLMRALYRCRNNVTDPEVLNTLHAIIMRYRSARLNVEPQLLHMGLKFAARSRSKVAMQRYLKMIKESGLSITSNLYRSVIAKFSIGHRGLGEIRNGRWKRSELREVLLGFKDCVNLPVDEQYHLGTFLVREEWQYLHGWVAVLGRCREAEVIRKEWELWKESKAYKHPRRLFIIGEENTKKHTIPMTDKLRGVYWFIEQMVYAGDIKTAWKMLHETEVPLDRLKKRTIMRMLDEPEHAGVWDDWMREEMLKKYDYDLARIEQGFGVRWIEREGEEGHHELFMDQEEALDRLASDTWRWEEENGYPWEGSPILPHGEPDEEIALELQIFCRNNTPDDKAISYTWGEANDKRKVLIDEKYHLVPSNCHYALWQAQLHESDSWIWIDSICITQDKLTEKGHQVNSVGHRFASAALVLCCIGRGNEDIDAIDEIWPAMLTEEISPMDQERWTPSDFSDHMEKLVPPPRQHLRTGSVEFKRLQMAWQSFCNRSYWQRLWVLQECRLAKGRVVLCGQRELGIVPLKNLKWMRVFGVADKVLEHTVFFPFHGFETCVPGNNIFDYGFLAQFKCVDARDRIYGTLSFMNWTENGNPIYPDYTRSALDLARMLLPSTPVDRDATELLRMLEIDGRHPGVRQLVSDRQSGAYPSSSRLSSFEYPAKPSTLRVRVIGKIEGGFSIAGRSHGTSEGCLNFTFLYHKLQAVALDGHHEVADRVKEEIDDQTVQVLCYDAQALGLLHAAARPGDLLLEDYHLRKCLVLRAI
ncbi:hypothetical protein BST61_g8671 [Cercospora zeina]